MSEDSIPRLRPPRPTGRDLPTPAAIEFALAVAGLESHHRMAAYFDSWRPGDIGHPPAFPQAVMDLFGQMSAFLGSDRKAESFFRSRHNWDLLRPIYAARHPEYARLQPGGAGPTRSQFHRRYNAAASDPIRLRLINHAFTQEALDLARHLGCFDPSRSSLANPDPRNWISGDGTVLPSRFRNGPGTWQVDTNTGELRQARFDPDAGLQTTGGGVNVTGVKFSALHTRTTYPREWVVLSIAHVPHGPGASEAAIALGQVEALLELGAHVDGLIWDMAMRGVHIDRLYSLGLLSLIKVARAPGGEPKELLLGPLNTNRGHEVVVRAVDGAAHIETFVGGETQLVRLVEPKILKRANRSGGLRWYGEYKVPADPRLPDRFHGDIILIRLDTTTEDEARGINRSEGIRPIAAGDNRWDKLSAGRPVAESLNEWLKRLWRNKRAPAVGKGRQHLRLLYGAMVANTLAALAFQNRTGQYPGAPPGSLAA